MARGQQRELISPAVQEYVRGNDESADPLLAYGHECCIEFEVVTDLQDLQWLSADARGFLRADEVIE